MSKAFRIPTFYKTGFHYKIRYFKDFGILHEYMNIKGYEVYEAFNLPIIKGNPFVKVNAN